MGLIKAEFASAKMQSFSMADIENQAAEILARAEVLAKRVEAAAKVSAKKILTDAHAAGLRGGWKEGWKKGHEEGTAAGREKALAEHKAELISTINALKAAAEEMNHSRVELESAALQDVLNLAVAIAERVT